MHVLTELIKQDMKPALGVTEPGAIAFAVATARTYAGGEVRRVHLRLNSGMYKNAFTCGIPGSCQVGNFHAAALGAVAADPQKGLECLEGLSPVHHEKAEMMVDRGQIEVEMSGISSRIFIEAEVETTDHTAVVTIEDAHTNIMKITVDGNILSKRADTPVSEAERDIKRQEEVCQIHNYTLRQLVDYVDAVPAEELAFIQNAYTVNMELFYEGMSSARTTYGKYLLRKNGGEVFSSDEQKTASLLCNGAIEARVLGLDKAAMSITGSGAHGIIATLPLYAAYQVQGYAKETLWRATALSYLICMYIKEYSGKLSAFCGCAIAAGTGMACGLVYLRGGGVEAMERTINNMASSITGMICDGGNQGCVMKGVVAVDAAYASADMAMQGVSIDKVHGINGCTPEETMRNMGLIASPGMVGTEKTIMEILESKKSV